ncbi:MAG: YbhB/YbcL family Raf kinase inhibitor-like protein [Thaumarchaeota archaeon]|nr:MAG: YbhB/YbcL family Raf kinase inhibitor-like protein [Nitrososphaerota archaeon]
MSKFSIISNDFNEGEEIPKEFGYKFENKEPKLVFKNIPEGTKSIGLIMDDPDAMAAVGKIWVHWLQYFNYPSQNLIIEGKTDFGEIGYGGPAPPNGRHTYIFKAYALDILPDLKEGYSKLELENTMKGHILAEAKLTGTFTP